MDVDVGQQCELGITRIEPTHMAAERHDAASILRQIFKNPVFVDRRAKGTPLAG